MAILLKENENKIVQNPVNGGIVAVVDVEFSGGLSPNTAQHAGLGSLAVAAVPDIPTSVVHRVLKAGGHSTVTGRGQFFRLVPPGYKLDPTLQEFPDGTSVQISEVDKSKPLEDATKPAVVNPDPQDLIPRGLNLPDASENYVRYKMNVYTPSEDLEAFGIKITPDSSITILSQDPHERNN